MRKRHSLHCFSLALFRWPVFSVIFCLVGILTCTGTARTMTVAEELAIDRLLGVLSRPWRINYVRPVSRDYLRGNALVTTGLPDRDRQAERVNRVPPAPDLSTLKSGAAARPATTVHHAGHVSPLVQPPPPPPAPPPSSPPAGPSTPTEVGVTRPMAPGASASPPTATAVTPGAQSVHEPRPRPQYFADPTP